MVTPRTFHCHETLTMGAYTQRSPPLSGAGYVGRKPVSRVISIHNGEFADLFATLADPPQIELANPFRVRAPGKPCEYQA
jgi:hypothetical protein